MIAPAGPGWLERVEGCLFGLALGDALAAPTEFLSVEKILARWPARGADDPGGPSEPAGDPARVTDDTQMTLAVADALLRAERLEPGPIEAALRLTFVRWLVDPENDRAPGRTCLEACGRLAAGKPLVEATVAGSKGCGANMRVAPAAFLPPQLRAPVAHLQAALTHGHPTALAASDLTCEAIALLAGGVAPRALLDALREYAASARQRYHHDWLGALWQRPGERSPEAFLARGWDECAGALDRVEAALARPDRSADPCLATGDGWVAEEALATALHCFLLYPSEPVAALRRAAVTRGDSDSIACLAGAFAGASLGVAAWPDEWLGRIEYEHRLAQAARGLARLR